MTIELLPGVKVESASGAIILAVSFPVVLLLIEWRRYRRDLYVKRYIRALADPQFRRAVENVSLQKERNWFC